MATPIDQITTGTFLTAEEITRIRDGDSHMVDNGYSTLDDMWSILRVMAVRIERARLELDYVTRDQFPSMVADAEMRIECDEAGLRNLASRAGF